MRITIAKHKYPEIEALSSNVASALINKAIESYSKTDDYKQIIAIFGKEENTHNKVNKATLYKNRSDHKLNEISTQQQVIMKTLIDDNSIDIMGGFNYE